MRIKRGNIGGVQTINSRRLQLKAGDCWQGGIGLGFRHILSKECGNLVSLLFGSRYIFCPQHMTDLYNTMSRLRCVFTRTFWRESICVQTFVRFHDVVVGQPSKTVPKIFPEIGRLFSNCQSPAGMLIAHHHCPINPLHECVCRRQLEAEGGAGAVGQRPHPRSTTQQIQQMVWLRNMKTDGKSYAVWNRAMKM